MKKNYIVVLQNQYLLFFADKPKKKGNYLSNVRLFEMNETTKTKDICAWSKNYEGSGFSEVADWE